MDGVLIIAGSFWERGGLQGRLTRLAHRLADSREVTVLTWSARAWPTRRRLHDRLTVVTVPSLVNWNRDHREPLATLNTAGSLLTGLMAALVLRRRFGTVLAAGLHPEGSLGALAAVGGRRFAVTTWLVGPLGNVARLRRGRAGRVVVRLLRRASWFVAQTEEAADELRALELPAARILAVGGDVDLERFAPGPTEPPDAAPSARRAIYTGRFDLRQKRLDLLLDAWRSEPAPGWELWLVGDGPDRDEVARLAAGLPSARLVGWQADVSALLRSADLFVLPTVAETNAFGMLEAMACGLAGLASAIPGLRARTPAGVRLVENDVPSWTRGLAEVCALSDDERRARGREARLWAETHADPDRAFRAWEAVLA